MSSSWYASKLSQVPDSFCGKWRRVMTFVKPCPMLNVSGIFSVYIFNFKMPC